MKNNKIITSLKNNDFIRSTISNIKASTNPWSVVHFKRSDKFVATYPNISNVNSRHKAALYLIITSIFISDATDRLTKCGF